VCCINCLMAKYWLNRPYGPLGIVYHLELKGDMSLLYARKIKSRLGALRRETVKTGVCINCDLQ